MDRILLKGPDDSQHLVTVCSGNLGNALCGNAINSPYYLFDSWRL